jgi:hypothetical protein
MAIKSKIELNAAFAKGKRPKEEDFRNWQDSYYHKVEDPIKVSGWMFRSFLKDLRSEGVAITTGGFTVLEIPFGVKKLKKLRVLGRATLVPGPLALTVSVQYYSDKQIASLGGVPSTGNPFPTTMFAHPLVGNGASSSFVISSAVAQFDQTLDFTLIPKDVDMDFIAVRFLVLTIQLAGGNFVQGSSNVYYGFEYE